MPHQFNSLQHIPHDHRVSHSFTRTAPTPTFSFLHARLYDNTYSCSHIHFTHPTLICNKHNTAHQNTTTTHHCVTQSKKSYANQSHTTQIPHTTHLKIQNTYPCTNTSTPQTHIHTHNTHRDTSKHTLVPTLTQHTHTTSYIPHTNTQTAYTHPHTNISTPHTHMFHVRVFCFFHLHVLATL